MYTSLSGKMNVMVRTCIEARSGITQEEAHGIDQRSFGAIWKRGHDPKKQPHEQLPPWLTYDRAKGRFFATAELKDVWRNYLAAEIFRKETSYHLPLTSYFDAKAYGLQDTTLHVVRKKKKVA